MGTCVTLSPTSAFRRRASPYNRIVIVASFCITHRHTHTHKRARALRVCIVTGMTKGFASLSRFGRRDKYVLSRRDLSYSSPRRHRTHIHIMCACACVCANASAHASPFGSFPRKTMAFLGGISSGPRLPLLPVRAPTPAHPNLPHTRNTYTCRRRRRRQRYILFLVHSESRVLRYTHTHTRTRTI
jgi:hypothetical protein